MRTLPQLAVSAKLLCLLMVVICGAVPSMVRSVRLYNDCSSSDVRVDSSGRVLADYDKANDKYTNLTIRSVDFGVKLTIYAEAAKRYLCFNRNWKLIGSKRFKGPMCQFYEDMVDNGYNRYRSAANESYFVGFNRKGRPLKAAEIVPRSRSNTPRRHKPHIRAKCLNFMKRDSVFSIGNHNSRMGGNHNPHSFSLSDHNRFLRYSGTSRGVGLPYRRGKIGAREEEKRPEKDLRKRHGAKGRGKGS